MRKLSLINWLRNVSIARKLYFTVGIMALLIATELMTLIFAINTLSSVRAYVGGEGLWSKAQKDAVYSLQKYGASYKDYYYKAYLGFLKVTLGDRKARQELSKPHPDLTAATQGFLDGRLHPEDIDGAIQLVQRFHSVSYIARAMGAWSRGDTMISELQAIGDSLHQEISGHPDPQKVNAILARIDPLDGRLTGIEDEFSYTLGEGSRWLANLIKKLLFGLVLTVEICGLSLTIFVSRHIAVGLNGIIRSARRLARGDLSTRALVVSGDEIGALANSFNEMAGKMQENINALQLSELNLQNAERERTQIIADIVQRNKDLEQFSYIVSHNLRAPVANILGLAYVMEECQAHPEEEREMKESLFHSVRKLDEVIGDLNYILQLRHDVNESRETVVLDDLVRDINVSIASLLNKEDVMIIADFTAAPGITTLKSYLYSIFFNLISNSIKYRKPQEPPVIHITSARPGDKIVLTFRDNGMGLDLKRREKEVFGLYKRFHQHIEGKGMGLFLVKTQVEALGGKITIASEVNEGTEFTIVLPEG